METGRWGEEGRMWGVGEEHNEQQRAAEQREGGRGTRSGRSGGERRRNDAREEQSNAHESVKRTGSAQRQDRGRSAHERPHAHAAGGAGKHHVGEGGHETAEATAAQGGRDGREQRRTARSERTSGTTGKRQERTARAREHTTARPQDKARGPAAQGRTVHASGRGGTPAQGTGSTRATRRRKVRPECDCGSADDARGRRATAAQAAGGKPERREAESPTALTRATPAREAEKPGRGPAHREQMAARCAADADSDGAKRRGQQVLEATGRPPQTRHASCPPAH